MFKTTTTEGFDELHSEGTNGEKETYDSKYCSNETEQGSGTCVK